MANKNFYQLKVLEADKLKVLKLIENLNSNTLTYRPENNKWSIAQIIYHIVKGEQYTLISLLSSVKPETKLNKVGFASSLKSFLLNVSLSTNLKFKAPPIAQKVPDEVNMDDILKKWSEVRNDLKDVCSKFPNKNYNKGVLKHPYIGMINLNQTLKFLMNHLKHHLKQIENLASPK